jgi:hypothetical protein
VGVTLPSHQPDLIAGALHNGPASCTGSAARKSELRAALASVAAACVRGGCRVCGGAGGQLRRAHVDVFRLTCNVRTVAATSAAGSPPRASCVSGSGRYAEAAEATGTSGPPVSDAHGGAAAGAASAAGGRAASAISRCRLRFLVDLPIVCARPTTAASAWVGVCRPLPSASLYAWAPRRTASFADSHHTQVRRRRHPLTNADFATP